MNQLLIATNNKGKLIEFQELLSDMDFELVLPVKIHLDMDVVEDGLTYAENAAKKAIAFANASGLISLGDDSGLEVDALDGAPGLYSARYGSTNGIKLSDADRRQYLISKLQSISCPWTARFKATVAIAIPDHLKPEGERNLYLAEGVCEGEIVPEERGSGGFGYDPIFLINGLGRTMAELPMQEKNIISHRARAVMQAHDHLHMLFKNISA